MSWTFLACLMPFTPSWGLRPCVHRFSPLLEFPLLYPAVWVLCTSFLLFKAFFFSSLFLLSLLQWNVFDKFCCFGQGLSYWLEPCSDDFIISASLELFQIDCIISLAWVPFSCFVCLFYILQLCVTSGYCRGYVVRLDSTGLWNCVSAGSHLDGFRVHAPSLFWDKCFVQFL